MTVHLFTCYLRKLSTENPNGVLFPKCELESYKFLPPAKKVWGKVKFLHLSVILFTGGICTGGSASRGWGLHPRGVCIQWVCMRGICIQGVSASRKGSASKVGRADLPPPPPTRTTGYGQIAGGTIPTEMHSC